ncbi:MAG TPA: hypothetical protein VHC91_05765 [Trinickia sp.]|uniref:hypothetical protein n=1 Tax=Trinickia sp. TaxID=2571163 RepID=UPI002C678EAA|nr:hypothetical protein [Trinickia sp.]HVW49899.1 hypothetical protein [Trinickia sp.]
MAIGTSEIILVCIPSTSSDSSGYCPSNTALTTTTAYLIDPSNAQTIDSLQTPFDYAYAGEIFSGAFCSVLILHFFAKGLGFVINFFKSA